MKVYTEVNYEWINDSLVKTSSESFDYSGDIALCGGGGGGGGGGDGGGTMRGAVAPSHYRNVRCAALHCTVRTYVGVREM